MSDRETVRSRRAFLATVAAATGTLGVLTVGQSLGWLRGDQPLRPARPRRGPAAAGRQPHRRRGPGRGARERPGVAAHRRRSGRDALLRARPAARAAADRLRAPDHLRRGLERQRPLARASGSATCSTAVGAPADATVRFTSLEPEGVYRVTELPSEFVRHPTTLVALELNGETLDLDHGYPARLIAPNRPGVLQTKWLSRLEVLRVRPLRTLGTVLGLAVAVGVIAGRAALTPVARRAVVQAQQDLPAPEPAIPPSPSARVRRARLALAAVGLARAAARRLEGAARRAAAELRLARGLAARRHPAQRRRHRPRRRSCCGR